MLLPRAAPELPQVDYRVVPLEYNMKLAGGANRAEAVHSIRILGIATAYGRTEAGIFLMGLLLSARHEDRELRAELVQALRHTRTSACAALLVDQLVGLSDSPENTLLSELLLDVLVEMPPEFIQERLDVLTRGERYAREQRRRFLQVLEDADSLTLR